MGLRVLLVEDDREFASYVSAALQLQGEPIEVTVARSLDAALADVRRADADAVLLDLNLPDSRGLATLRSLLEASPPGPIVVVTGMDDMALAREAVRLGAQDWLIKGDVAPDLIHRSLRYAIERKTLADGLLRAQKLEVVGRLAASAAHEFNNVLAAIIGSARLIELATDADAREAGFELLRQSARRGAALSRQVLSLARNPPTNAVAISTRVLVENVSTLLRALFSSTVQVAIGPLEDLPIRIDPSQFDQLLLNLALNARDAMPDGGVLSVSVTREPPGEGADGASADPPHAVLEVRDTGVGIDASVLPLIFDPFFSTKPRTGTGLGLAICAEIVERFGGAIRAKSEAGNGATFTIRFPVVADA